MKKSKLLIVAICFLLQLPLLAQVQIDRTIQLTGSGINAKVTGIQNVSANEDVVSVDYLQRDSLKFAVATGSGTSGNPYVVALTPVLAPSSLSVGMMVMFQASVACGSGPVYVNVSGTGNIAIKKYYNADLAGSDIQSGQMVTMMYDGTNFQMLSQLGNAPSSASDPTLTYTTNGF